MSFNASDVAEIRKNHGFSMMESKRACQIGEDRFDGDYDLGARWILANQLAVNVRGGPEARALYNDDQARASREAEEARKN